MSEKKYPTRMHEMLTKPGEPPLKSGEIFTVSWTDGEKDFSLNSFGVPEDESSRDADGFCYPATGYEVAHMINHGITRRPLQEEDDGKRGLYSKYKVTKADGTPVDGDCFILRPDRDEAAISALEAYADATNNENLAADIREWLRTTRRPRLTDEQVAQLKALVTLGYGWLVKDLEGLPYACASKPKKKRDDWRDGGAFTYLYPFMPTNCLMDLPDWSDPEPLDIVQTLRDAGRLEDK